MKKALGVFFALFISILLLGGTALVFGWAGRTVPPGQVAVMRSKTHGVDSRLITEGHFRWVWYKLIPGNVRLEIFSRERLSREISIQGELPLSTNYASFSGVGVDFSYRIRGSFSFILKSEVYPALLSEGRITGAGDSSLENYRQDLLDRAVVFLVQRLKAITEEQGPGMDPLGMMELSGELEGALAEAFPEMEYISCAIAEVRFPDFQLYATLKALYQDYLSQQRQLLQEDIHVKAEQQIGLRLSFDGLERMGEILTRYPLLIQYLALDRGTLSPADLGIPGRPGKAE